MLGLLAACSGGDAAGPGPASLDDPAPSWQPSALAQCRTPDTGCPCTEEGESIACGTLSERRGEYVICSMGARVCARGVWSECEASHSVTTTPSAPPSGLRLQALSGSENCQNLCDPQCMAVADTPDGLVVGDDLLADPGGLTLPGGTWGGSCSDLSIAPASPTVKITQIHSNGSVAADPATLAFSAACAGGASVQPSWSMDAYDRAVIDAEGNLTVFSGIASPILVTAASAADDSTELVNVIVNIEDRGTDSGVAAALDGAGFADTGTAPKTLYPYKNTVFPLDLEAPLVQWDPGGNTASAVQVALRYPAGAASPRFWYSKIYNGSEPKHGTLVTTAPAWQIPQEIWSAFDRSAAGDPAGAEIIIQRYYGGLARTPMTIPVRFASAPLSGTVYYTQYLRSLYSASGEVCSGSGQLDIDPATYTPGDLCPVGNCVIPGFPWSIPAAAATTRAIDLSTPSAPNKDPFNGTAGCPVCHSISADGTRHVSTNQASQSLSGGTSKGINDIGLDAAGDPAFSPVGSAPNYALPSVSSDSALEQYGFSFSAIVPDGSLLLQGPAYWGSTQTAPASNNVQDGTLKGLTNHVKPYFFVDANQAGLGVQFATTGALPAHTRSGNVLTASSNGALSIDGTAMAPGYSVLVKDESGSTASLAKNGVYTVTSAGSGWSKWKLTRRSDADSAGEIAPRMDVRVTDGNAQRGKTFYVSSPTSGSITINTTGITFTENVLPAIQFTSSPLAATYATTAELTPGPATRSGDVLTAASNGALTIDAQSVGLGDTVLVKDQADASQNGLYTLTQAGNGGAKWRLTRHPSFDSAPTDTSDAAPGMEIRVSSGAVNAGKVFQLSSPASSPVAVNTSALTFQPTSLPAMMVPVFSPDGTKVAYVNADADPAFGSSETGWRRGLTMFSFDQATMAVSDKRRLLNHWSSGSPGTPIKWPFFESDSRSLLYVKTHPNEYCSSSAHQGKCAVAATDTYASASCTADGFVNVNSNLERACFENARGSMSPTTHGFWPGRIYSIDGSAEQPSDTEVELAKLNDGDDDGGADDATDADKAYQPTVLPFSVGGYRWVIFTSPRPYGNQFNMKGTHFSCGATMLWVSALDDRPADGTDRSHPAFFLPGQNVRPITELQHYVNERGYLVPSLCKEEGASCTSNDECCGASDSPAAAACRAPSGWSPADGPPAKTCAQLSGTCSNAEESCNSPADCCNGAACVDFRCAAPPSYEAADFTRQYDASCPESYQPRWQLLSFYLTTEGDSRLQFSARAANSAPELDSAPVLDLGEATSTVVSPAPPEYIDVGAVLDAASSNGVNHLRLTVSFVPSSDGLTAPVLHDWEMRYTCEPAQ